MKEIKNTYTITFTEEEYMNILYALQDREYEIIKCRDANEKRSYYWTGFEEEREKTQKLRTRMINAKKGLDEWREKYMK